MVGLYVVQGWYKIDTNIDIVPLPQKPNFAPQINYNYPLQTHPHPTHPKEKNTY